MNPPIIQISSITKSFGKQSVLRGLDWNIAPGKVIGLLGRNGAGKSTLMESMKFPGELRRTHESSGETCVIAYAPEVALSVQGVRVEALSLEDLFIEVTQ